MNQSTIFRQFTFHEQAFLISERFVLHGFHPIKLCLVQFFYGQFFLPLLRWMSTILRKPEAPCRHSSQVAEGLETRRVNNILKLVVIDRRYPAEQRSLFKRIWMLRMFIRCFFTGLRIQQRWRSFPP
ncbi:hypothetical protein T4A_296 [Trichinella pseudospiralis]|uniref:Uncharacterized protein n=1 Tax=Trichinella pseudospiralis TaxID=6337 RepID=A0A0V1E9B5_TRIPS|nr:hypothetical protein T4A_296 [Trichinella pseudospiralis]